MERIMVNDLLTLIMAMAVLSKCRVQVVCFDCHHMCISSASTENGSHPSTKYCGRLELGINAPSQTSLLTLIMVVAVLRIFRVQVVYLDCHTMCIFSGNGSLSKSNTTLCTSILSEHARWKMAVEA